MSVFADLELAPGDPILGMKEAFLEDSCPDKVNLSIGVYLDETGRVPLMDCVRAAEKQLAEQYRPRDYLPITGLPAYTAAVRDLVFGTDSPAVAEGRVLTCQSLAGTGALRVGASLLALTAPDAPVLISDPSWENHELLFSRAGFRVGRYRYYDPASRAVDVAGMLEDLAHAAPGTIVVLHARCHNPTGCDLTAPDWAEVVDIVAERGLVPFIDMAYQGFAEGLDQDAQAVRAFAAAGVPYLVANSFSKTFGLYGERVGGIHFVTETADEAVRVASQVKTVIRSQYSNPPTQGAAIVATVLTTPELRARWEDELGRMRTRLIGVRSAFRAGLEAAGVTQDLTYLTTQAGLFSYSGIGRAEMLRLRREFHVYGLDSGRLCLAGLNPGNLEYAVGAIAQVMRP